MSFDHELGRVLSVTLYADDPEVPEADSIIELEDVPAPFS